MKNRASFSIVGLITLWGLIGAIIWHAEAMKRPQVAAPNQLNTADIKDLERLFHNYLVSHPQLLLEMESSLNQQEQAAQQASDERIKGAVTANFKHLLGAPGELSALTGAANKPWILWYFTQPICPSCHKSDHLVTQFLANHPDIEVRTFLWPFFGGEAVTISQLIMAGRYQNCATQLLEATGKYRDALTLPLAQELIKTHVKNANFDRLTKDSKQNRLTSALKDNFWLAKKLELTGTPTVIITSNDGKKVAVISGFSAQLTKELEAEFTKLQR